MTEVRLITFRSAICARVGQDFVLHAVGEEGVRFFFAQIFERKHRDAFLGRSGRGRRGCRRRRHYCALARKRLHHRGREDERNDREADEEEDDDVQNASGSLLRPDNRAVTAVCAISLPCRNFSGTSGLPSGSA